MRRITFKKPQLTSVQLKETKKRVNNSLNEARQQHESLIKQLTVLSGEITDAAQKKDQTLDQIEEVKSLLATKQQEYTEMLKKGEAYHKALDIELADKKHAIAVASQQLAQLTETFKAEQERVDAELKQYQNDIDKLIDQNAKLEIEHGKLNAQYFSAADQLPKIKASIQENQKILQAQLPEIEQRKNDLKEINYQIQKRENVLQAVNDKISEVEKQQHQFRKDVTELQQTTEELLRDKENTEKEIQNNKEKLLTISHREARFDELKDRLKELYAKIGIKINID